MLSTVSTCCQCFIPAQVHELNMMFSAVNYAEVGDSPLGEAALYGRIR